ncbi:lipopolysaccharide biosynthesis protein [Myroides odoratimimus]|uniref:lipopolysaccharide biosynthesis protein n=1 Tax=Myroides odoratimimus TaxID=76832 RepID=UPI002578EF9D|nr:oligosaccharide flippase family protein [Myroides odoratimimus]MDM1450398.1 oligosaccharide flippase family protein [Myroides odoratimimus]
MAKNTVFLYFRMFLYMAITLYTSRVVLTVLGVEDFGIYSVVGGIVALFSFLNSSMTSATQRFLAYDIGQGDEMKLKKTFNVVLNTHILIAIIIFVFVEIFGIWYLENKLVIDYAKKDVAFWLLQFSILTLLVKVIQVPYKSLLIAREKMSIYAIIGILEVLLSLVIVYFLLFTELDKLFVYGFLVFIVNLLITSYYWIYCIRRYRECRYEFYYDKKRYIEVVSYSGWNLFGNFASVSKGQGVNMILNLFYGTVVNAAYGIAIQVQTAVNVFVNNFQMAVNPQIIKTYASDNKKESFRLICISSKYSFYIMTFLVCIIYYNIDFILDLWLGTNIPQYTNVFTQLVLIGVLIDTVSNALMMGIQATGRIKIYQITVGFLVFLNLPISYFLLKYGYRPSIIFYVSIIISIVSFFMRLYFLTTYYMISYCLYVKEVLKPVIMVSVMFLGINTLTTYFLVEIVHSFITILIQIFVLSAVIIIFGISRKEKEFVKKFIKTKI